jgi:hypothetical protein
MSTGVGAQSATDGAIGGRVLRSSGDPARGALVTAVQTDTGLAVRARSGAQGEFLVVRLPVGEYMLTVADDGAEMTLPELLVVELGEVTEVDARLSFSASGASSPSAMGHGTGTELTQADLASLPVDGGDWRSLSLATAGANPAAEEDEAAGEASYRGSAIVQNSSRADGTSGDESFGGTRLGAGVAEDTDTGSDSVADGAAGVGSGPQSVADGGQRAGSAYVFSQAAVREFRVQGQSSAAEYGSALYGHGVGGVVTAVSRSGGSTLHGMAFYTVRDSAWAAVNPFAIDSTYVNGTVTNAWVRPLDVRQQFGGRLGGPLLEHRSQMDGRRAAVSRIFYFYAFDAQRRNFPAISAPGYAGFYSLTATQAALLANRGVTPAKTMAALNYLDSLTGTVSRRADQTVNFARLDWMRKSGSRMEAEYNRARWSLPGGARSGAVVDRGRASIGSSYGAVDQGAVRWVQMLTAGLSNEMRAQYGHELQYETAQPPLPQEPAIAPGGMAPEVSIGPQGLVFGTPAALGQRAYPDEQRAEVVDVLAWVKGRHFLQAGADFSALSDLTESLTNEEGTFSYDSGATGGKAGGLVDWITDYTFNVNAYPNGGCPSITATVHDFCFRSYSQSFGQQSLSFATQEWAGFLQDDWRVARGLTVHVGARYEYEFLPLPQQPNAALDEVFGARGATSVYPEDRNNLGPRIGVAWQPFGRGSGVVRVGYGVYYGKLPGATVRAALLDTALANSTTHIRITPTTVTSCPQNTQVGFGYACAFLQAPPGVVAATTSAMVFDRRFRLPMVQQGTFSVEHSVGWNVMASAGYVVNLDRQLQNSVDINIAPSADVKEFQLQGGTGKPGAQDGETFAVPAYSERVSTLYGPVTDIVSNANATYNGVTLEARRGLGGRTGSGGAGRGLEFHVAWTWSKAIDFGQNSGAAPRGNGQFDPFTVAYDKGLSALDFPHRVVATAVWAPRWEPGMVVDRAGAALRSVVNGWSVGGIFSEGSGRAYSYEVFGGTRLAGGRESINGSGGSTVLPTAGRNTLRLPDTANFDLRLSRNFRVSEKIRLRGSVEGFNVMNHLNYSGVTQRAYLLGTAGTAAAGTGVTPLVFQNATTVATEGLNVLPFGAYTAAATSQARERQIEMGLRLEF